MTTEIDQLKAELETAKKALSKIYRWTQQRDISNPRSIIAGLAGDQLTKEERVKICNQEKQETEAHQPKSMKHRS